MTRLGLILEVASEAELEDTDDATSGCLSVVRTTREPELAHWCLCLQEPASCKSDAPRDAELEQGALSLRP